MASVAYQKSWDDPAPGTVIQVPAGEPLDLGFTCVNDAEKVVTFTARVDGLGPWAPDKEPKLPVVPFESGLIRVTLASTGTAEPGDYPFTVHLFLNGDPVESNGTIALVMRLTPSLKPVEVVVAPVVQEVRLEPVMEMPTVQESPPPIEEPVIETPEIVPAEEKKQATEKPKEKPKKSKVEKPIESVTPPVVEPIFETKPEVVEPLDAVAPGEVAPIFETIAPREEVAPIIEVEELVAIAVEPPIIEPIPEPEPEPVP
ncbi:MAG: hypothetical protein H7Y17_04915 [Chlorobia bacterium]|nr:hypothetical protein [Fimbriimonadaceae bacterium]